ncbi:MAG: DUF4126 family protein [Gammaproteobacteria bacterium]|nr:DUF4126 family protein [Pseudomonadales bacterium]MCP5349175.1 DUF4126 family protein [Pseudomonadales bacterium]
MENYDTMLGTIALTMGASWASGINLYAALLVLGLGGMTGSIDLPPDLEMLANPLVVGAAGIMYLVEFVVDKVPGVDTAWDGLQTFVRIPAGALLAAGAVGDVSPVMEVATGLMGGGLAATSHFTKAGTRALINTSPEPLSNWGASLSEDLAVFGGLWVALNHPVLFLILLAVFIVLVIWLLPKIWRLLKAIFRKLGSWLGLVNRQAAPGPALTPETSALDGELTGQLTRLSKLHRDGTLTDSEFELAKRQLLGG